MRGTLLISLLFGSLLNVSMAASDVEHSNSLEESFPEPLTADDFHDEMLNNLHLVEFFSPYCGHCRTLAPIWKEAWQEFHEEGESLNITLNQVDCVQSADLCFKEGVAAFPKIALYGPDGFLKEFPSDLKRTKENLIAFARKEAQDTDNLVASQLVSQSTLLDAQSIIELLGGSGTVPHLVSFWPSTTLENVDDREAEFENCDNCRNFQRTWTVLSNRLKQDEFNTAHLNCESNKKICTELGYGYLAKNTNHRADRHPQVALILPGKSTNNFVPYNGESNSVKAYYDFAIRTHSNAIAPEISANTLLEKISKPLDIGKSPNTKHPKTYIVFNYDPATVVSEDFDILEHLIEPLSKIRDFYLYKSTDDLMKLSHDNYEKMYSVINYNESEPTKVLNEDYFIMSTLTQYPTFFMFKEGDLIPNVFHGYSTTEARSLECILDWINTDSLAFMNELTSSNFGAYMNFLPEFYYTMAIQIIDTSSPREEKKSINYLSNYMISAYDYESIRDNYLYDNVLKKRTAKEKAVDTMKGRHASSVDVVKKMREEVYHDYDHRVLFTYLDISKYRTLLSDVNLNICNRNYENGDVIVIDKRSGKFYYDKDPFGSYLTSDSPYYLRETLGRLNFPTLYQSYSLERILMTSPYGKSFRALEIIHQFGFPGYIALFGILILMSRVPKVLKRIKLKRKYDAKRDCRGILGKNNLED